MKKVFKHILYAIAFILLLVVNIPVWLFWFLPMYTKDTFESIKWDWDSWSLSWDVSNKSNFYKESMPGWWGFVVGSNIVYVDYFPRNEIDKKHIRHEKRHVLQNYIFNILFYPLYILFSLFILAFMWSKNPYLDNPFERDARRAAGEEVNIPIEKWKNDINDRWPWW